MKIGVLAGNRLLPIILIQNIKKQLTNSEVIAVCFKHETNPIIRKYADKTYWIDVGNISSFREIQKKENLREWIMAGQINPLKIFKSKNWEKEVLTFIENVKDFRPHTFFTSVIQRLEQEGIVFLDSTFYLKEFLANEGIMNNIILNNEIKNDINFGVKIISRFVELDVGQTIVTKKSTVVALESLEGTDRTIMRGCKFAGNGCTVIKFSKINQDLRFDVPVVGISTLQLLKKLHVAALVLESDKTLILEKEKFLNLAHHWKIPIVGHKRIPA